MKKKKQHPMTLLEIMIVIFIIGIIGSVIGYNMKGSLEEGKAFKSREGARQVYEILTLEMAKGTSLEKIESNPKTALKNSGVVKNPEELLKDGWSHEFELKLNEKREDIRVISKAYRGYLERKDRSDQLPFYMDIDQ